MTAFKPSKMLKREDSFLQKFSNRYGYRGLGAMGKCLSPSSSDQCISSRSFQTQPAFEFRQGRADQVSLCLHSTSPSLVQLLRHLHWWIVSLLLVDSLEHLHSLQSLAFHRPSSLWPVATRLREDLGSDRLRGRCLLLPRHRGAISNGVSRTG